MAKTIEYFVIIKSDGSQAVPDKFPTQQDAVEFANANGLGGNLYVEKWVEIIRNKSKE